MKSTSNRPGLVKRFCDLLGRQHPASGVLDRIARLVVPLPPPMGFAAAGRAAGPNRRNREDDLRKLIHSPFLAQGPMLDATNRGDAPTTEHDPASGSKSVTIHTANWGWWSRLWGTDEDVVMTESGKQLCAPDRYHGMHGTPCLYACGSDTKCPKGTVSGWFWSYKTPVGVIYYVDCCGGTRKSDVWCGWTSENNWCGPWGRTANTGGSQDYNCTLAMPSAVMMTRGISATQFEVVGVDP